jgi:hypothetical protein
MNPPRPPIPLHLWIAYGGDHHDDDTVEHEVRFRVVSNAAQPVVAIVQSDAHATPRVLRHLNVGELDLPRLLLDRVTLICFNRLIGAMTDIDGSTAAIWIQDGAEWLRRRLPREDGAVVIAAMARHVEPGTGVSDLTWVWQD